jgi:prephenate dehydrogenase
MWAELCMENHDFLISELDSFISAVERYRNALGDRDINMLKELLEEGSRLKGESDK